VKRQYSTREAAKKIGRNLPSIQRLIKAGVIEAPPVVEVGTVKVRLWSDRDIEKARKTVEKIRKGRKPKSK
jgi:hypothetical protein